MALAAGACSASLPLSKARDNFMDIAGGGFQPCHPHRLMAANVGERVGLCREALDDSHQFEPPGLVVPGTCRRRHGASSAGVLAEGGRALEESKHRGVQPTMIGFPTTRIANLQRSHHEPLRLQVRRLTSHCALHYAVMLRR